jgi:hypothetical protein
MLITTDIDDGLRYSIALGHMAALMELARIRSAQRAMQDPDYIRSASDRHLVETGHRLQFGCCRDRAELATAA